MNEFNNFFEIQIANTKYLKDIVYRLRYDIFVNQCGFSLSANSETQKESDCFDSSALPFLVKYKPTNEYVATMRLVYPDPVNGHTYPIEEYCKLYDEKLFWDSVGRENTLELSRISISKNFLATLTAGSVERKNASYISHIMFAYTLNIAQTQGFAFIIGSTVPAFSRMLTSLGIENTQIGPAVAHAGWRFPTVVEVDSVLASIEVCNPALYDLVCGSIVKFPKL